MHVPILASSRNLYGAIDQRERHRLELIIATARGFLAAVAMVAIHVDPSEPTRHAHVAYQLLVLYDLHSFAVLLLLRFGPVWTARLAPGLHAIDLAWAVAITFLTEGPNSSFFALFVFVLLAAATRWGFRETLVTGVIAVVVFLLEGVAARAGLMIAILDLGSLLMRCAYFLLATFLLAYLSEQAKGLRAGGEVINRLTSKVNVRDGLITSVQAVLGDLLTHMGSTEAVVAFEELSSGRLVLWEASPAEFRSAELHPDRRTQYFFAVPKDVSAFQVTRGRGGLEYLAVKDDGNRVRNIRLGFPAPFRGGSWTTVVGVSFSVGEDWRGRLFLVNPTARPSGTRRLRFLQTIVVHLTPVLQNVYLLRRLRLRVGALERARVARELHDSVLQSLTSIEMQLDVARRDSALAPRPAGELAHIQNLLRQEILNIRDLMEHLRPRVTDTRKLVERLADLGDRFRRETGIQVRCRANIGEAELEPEICHEVTRIVQEALTNIRKHSGATWAYVNFEVDDWAWKLTVTDNGCGYGFVGTLTHAELAARRIGPRTIRERVEAVGGKLQVHSSTNGLRLEMIGRLKKPWILTSSA